MKTNHFLAAIAGVLLSGCVASSPDNEIISLYDGPAPGTESWTQEEQVLEDADGLTYINVTDPELEVFVPDKPNGSGMLVCPGDAAEMMGDYFTRILLPERDRMAGLQGLAPEEAEISLSIESAENTDTRWAYADADRAMAVIRENAAKWNIDPDRIGIMGFSAGAMTAMNQAFHHSEATRPDFVAAVYTGVPEGFEVPADAAPLFLCSPVNDIFQPQETYRVLTAWRAAKVPVELHYYSKCGHGFAVTQQNAGCDLWMGRQRCSMAAKEAPHIRRGLLVINTVAEPTWWWSC